MLYIEWLWGFWRKFIQSVLQGFLRRFIQSALIGYGGFGDALYRVFSKVIGLLATLYIECFLRLWGFWRSFIQSVLLVMGVLTIYRALIGYGGFGDALYRECFGDALYRFYGPFIQSALIGYGGFGDALYRVFSKIGLLAMLYIECFLSMGFWLRFNRLWGFWRSFIQSVLLGYGGFGDALYRVFIGLQGFW